MDYMESQLGFVPNWERTADVLEVQGKLEDVAAAKARLLPQ